MRSVYAFVKRFHLQTSTPSQVGTLNMLSELLASATL